MKTNRNNRNIGLDILRACAISLVVGMHLIGNFFPGDYGIFWYLAYLGVDIFFVLSGFLIGTILINSIDATTGHLHLSALQRFYIRRWLRTVPLYYVLLILNFLVSRFYLSPDTSLSVHYFFWLQNFSTPPSHFFGESWSLSVEEWFYFIFPLGLYLFFKLTILKNVYSVKLLVYTCIFILAATGLRAINLSSPYREFNVVVTRLDAIGYGVLFAILDAFYLTAFFKRNRFYCGVIGVGLLMVAIFLFLYKKLSGSWYVVYYPISGLGLSFIVIYMKQLQRPFVSESFAAIFERLSTISYSLYLNNLIIIYLVLRYVHLWPAAQLLVALLGIVLFSSFTYHGIEKRVLMARDHFYPAMRHRLSTTHKQGPV